MLESLSPEANVNCMNILNSKKLNIISILIILMPTSAFANGAMGLALSIFSWNIWLIYICATVIFEAIFIGLLLKVHPFRALSSSLLANLLTGVVGCLFSGILGYMFIGMFGSALNPNPFGQTVVMLTVFGVVSAIFEAQIWYKLISSKKYTYKKGRVIGVSLLAHLIGVPLALAILLIPARPYTGLEMQTSTHRDYWLQRDVIAAANNYIKTYKSFPRVNSYAELLEALRPNLQRFKSDPALWAAAYKPDFHRFDTKEMKRIPRDWNPEVSSIIIDRKDYSKLPDKTVWVIRERYTVGSFIGYSGFVIYTPYGDVRESRDSIELGYLPIKQTPTKSSSSK